VTVRRALVLVLCVVGLVGAPAANAADEDLAGDPMARAAMLALPSIYRVDVTLSIPAVRTSAGEVIEVPHGGVVAERGTATAVAPGGWLVSAAHVVDPNPQTLARIGYQRWQTAQGVAVNDVDARRWVIESGAEAVGARVLAVRVTQADPGTGLRSPARWTGLVERTAGDADLSLVRIRAPGAPALAMEDTVSLGTPVVTIGFGRHDAWDEPGRPAAQPAVRRGELERTGALANPRRAATVVSTDIQGGDSGGPAVDADGRVRGIVVLRGEGGGIIEQVGAVRRLLDAEGQDPEEGRAGAAYRRALESLWALDVTTAERELAVVRRTFPEHTLAQTQALRAAGLADGSYVIEAGARHRSLLVGVAALALLLSLACAARLAWLSAADRRRPGRAPGAP
jgi:hypothetical protein